MRLVVGLASFGKCDEAGEVSGTCSGEIFGPEFVVVNGKGDGRPGRDWLAINVHRRRKNLRGARYDCFEIVGAFAKRHPLNIDAPWGFVDYGIAQVERDRVR